MRRTVALGIGGVSAAFLGALCCAGPLIFVVFGVGAGVAATFEPLRPVFGALMVAAFALGFYAVYGRNTMPVASADGAACEVSGRHKREEAILWGAVILALFLWTFPTWSAWLI